MSDIHFDIGSLHAAYQSGIGIADVIDTVLARIEAAGDPGIFIHLATRAEMLAAADALGPFDPVARPLWGIPFAVKDNIDVAGMPTTAACAEYAYTPARDAAVVARLRAAGALVVGKTNLDQFATGLVGVRTPWPIPRNAIDPKLVPGGSSSGSAVATARGIVSFALGTDTAGSGRVPAGLNSVVGLKPSVGALSTAGVVPACRTLDCVSVFALTVDDAYAVFSVAAARDAADPYSRDIAVQSLAARPPALSVGIPAKADLKFFGDAAMQAGFEASLALLSRLGCRLVEIPFGDFYATADLLYEGAWVAERYAAIRDFFEVNEAALHPVTRKIIGGARNLSAADAFRGFYALQAYKARLAPVIASVDLFCLPTAPIHYTLDAVLADPIATNSRLGTYTNFVNLLDMCGIAVPTGTRADGLPMSVTLLAAAGKDGLLASVARDLHSASDLTLGATGWRQPSAQPAAAPAEDSIELVVVGAHLSGMPLNGQLKNAGARFCRATRTSPSYKLYELAGQIPPKPGLVRVGSGGAAIEVEVWRLCADAFGRFVAAIPPPLGIGTIELDDGTSAKGFLAETAGLLAATDISAYGGWRNFVARAHEARRQPESVPSR
ncbi:MAG: allophanate hydrolase [Mesorhizobium sp.]|uniref:allophanate hydrolase n=8 Tax=Mesorhizobium TaxID=68287 RepID=UPI000F764777|nr:MULTISPECIES: allophanate hydrolase [unclassified Mesorhizobium]AZO50844.1 allophanate hydrolase [Mesorhizobium sp. M4B.F.Ca.ET.058.02.1.1]RVC44882.1 allophanate hydrolase [Mesorhizobium sp. M4A.F.Ca.ET.090.04.2.1]RWC48904.1 MAG: allophanate hydrolase [Mesorhizobium sp.]RWD17835.1 MAG: allophanate hydrolase [Mesorhizobium sp.]RWD57517.1 MAG: allophanate hydrolase [Mesorhizobium sp.]